MCWCTPNVRTPQCERPGCHPPGSPRPPSTPPGPVQGVELLDDGRKVLAPSLAQRAELRLALGAYDDARATLARWHEDRAAAVRRGESPSSDPPLGAFNAESVLRPILGALREILK